MQRRSNLKRTPFKRTGSWLKRSGIKPPKRGHVPKGRVNDDPDYRAFVREHPCCACIAKDRKQEWRTEAAHTDALGREGSGIGQKTDDRSCIALCVPCHYEFDKGKRSKKLFEQDHRLDIPAIVAALNRAYDERQRAA